MKKIPDNYWWGTTPIVKKAVLEWIASDGKKTQSEIARKYGITSAIISIHFRKLKALGYLRDVKIQTHVGRPRGGKSHPILRAYWRKIQDEYRAKHESGD